jgi:hypothetical protein
LHFFNHIMAVEAFNHIMAVFATLWLKAQCLLRRLEKNHDGIRSATTRQHYIQIYQAIKYLSLDIADFLEKGPEIVGALCM